MIEYLAVEDDGDAAILVEDGLLAVVEPDDAETRDGKSDAGREEETTIVGTAMLQRPACAAASAAPAPAAP